ncbi:MAG: PPC domain-containing protein, partial [Proteobacteria bacterium]|nr:PPC domain-containing protein [Pseudomonadota bacterium]
VGTLDSRLRSFNDFVSNTLDHDDFYRFTLTGAAAVTLRASNFSADATLQLQDAQGRVIVTSNQPQTSDETIVRGLAAGDYFVRVLPAGNVETGYTLDLSAALISSDGAGNTRDEALSIGTLDGRVRSFNDFVSGTLDPNDFYRFTLANAASLTVQLTGLSDNAQLQLLDSQGRQIVLSQQPQTNDEMITRNLAAGEYFVRVFPAGNVEANYRLDLSAALFGSDAAGNTRDEALFVGALDERVRGFNDFVSGAIETNDFYRISLANAGQLHARLTGLSANADLQLLDADGRQLAISQHSGQGGTDDDAIDRSLAPGDYFVRVFAVGGAETNYHLDLSAVTIAADGAGNTRDAARGVGPLDTRTRSFTDFVSGALDTSDFYSFTLDSASTVHLRLHDLAANADIQLQNAQGGAIVTAQHAGTDEDTIDRDLAAGTYFVRVFPAGSAETAYGLDLSATPNPSTDAGNTLATARDLGAIDTRILGVVDESVGGSGDPNDFYRLTIGSSSAVQIDVNGLSADATIQLLDGAGQVLQSRQLTAGTHDTLVSLEFAGTYFLRVAPVGVAEAGYHVELTATDAFAVNDSRSTATPVAMGARTVTIDEAVNGLLAASDFDDFYRFTIVNPGTFHLTLSGLTADADVELQDASGGVIAQSNRSGTQSETIDAQLSSGTYFVDVFPFLSARTKYQLTMSVSGQPEDDDTLFTARPVTVGANPIAFNDRVGSATDGLDLYRFTLAGATTVHAALSGLTANADLVIIDATGNLAAFAASASQQAESLDRVLTAGTYYLGVISFSGDTPYRLTMSTSAVDTGGDDTSATARPVVLGSTTQTFNDRIGGADTADFYRFTLASPGSFHLALTGLTADADVELLDATGTSIALSNAAGTQPEAIDRILAAGTYFVRVFPFTGETPYQLQLSVTGQDTGSDDTRANARPVSLGSAPIIFADRIGGTDQDDFYRFALGTAGQFHLRLSGLAADADVELLDAAGLPIALSDNASNEPEQIDRILAAGTYFVHVFPFQGETPYQLALSVTGQDTGGDDTRQTARAVTLGALPTLFNDRVGGTDANDFYRFTLGAPGTFRLNLVGLSADADVQLLDATGAEIARSENAFSEPESMQRLLAAGTYFVRVYPFDGETTYQLQLSVTGQDTGGDDTRQTARTVTLGAVPTPFNDRIGGADANDFYRFTLSNPGQLRLGLTGLTADADVELLDGTGTSIAVSDNAGSDPESIERVLTAGTYFVRVFPFFGETPYQLSLAVVGQDQIDEAGNTLATARDLGTVGGSVTSTQGRVGALDHDDFYRFQVTQAGQLSVSLTGLTADADMQLLNGNGSLIDQSTNSGTQPEGISATLTPGVYFARVTQFDGEASYTLTLGLASTPLHNTTPAADSAAPASGNAASGIPDLASLAWRDVDPSGVPAASPSMSAHTDAATWPWERRDQGMALLADNH